MATYTDDFNHQLILEAAGRSGGEGAVHGIVGRPGKIAKIYHADKLPDGELAEKLRVMIANPPHDPMKAHGHMSLAWPESRVFKNGRFVGYVMPRVDMPYEVVEFYNPTIRRQKHPGVTITRRKLYAIARNLAAALAAVHASGYVVVGLNASDVLVNPHSLVTLIGADSFQVRDEANGRIFYGRVGVTDFTPSEMYGRDMMAAERHWYHDAFGLAVLIFMILMEGNHPFTGYPRSGNSFPSLLRQDNIARGIFPYNPASGYEPPRGVPDFMALPATVRNLFWDCFVDGHKNPLMRPTALVWHRRLNEVFQSLDSDPDEVIFPPALPNATQTPLDPKQRKLALFRLLDESFALDDLRDLCFEMAIDFESLPGEGKRNKARELVQYCVRNGRLDELTRLFLYKRPHLAGRLEG